MRKNNRKGFTIVELVIVIAVIGILAGVMIPTISGVIAKANDAADLADAKAIYTEYVANLAATGADIPDGELYVELDGGVIYVVTDGQPEKVDAAPQGATKIN